MKNKKQKLESSQSQLSELIELTRTLLIIQLGLAKIPQNNIKEIAGCSINRVNTVLQLVTLKKNNLFTRISL